MTNTRTDGPPELPDHLRRSAAQNRAGDARLHVQASEWYESRSDIQLAIQHALAGQDWARGAYLIDRLADSLLSCGKTSELYAYLLDLPVEILAIWPRLGIIQAHLELMTGKVDGARSSLAGIASQLAVPEIYAGWHLPPGDPPGSGLEELHAMAAGVQAELALQSGQFEQACEQAEQALAGLPLSRPLWRGLAALWGGKALERSGRLEAACVYYARARQALNQAGSLDDALKAGLLQGECLYRLERLDEALGLFQGLLGRLIEAEKPDPQVASRLYSQWALLLSARGQQEEALVAAAQAQKLAGEAPEAHAEASLAQAWVYLARREYPAARRSLAGAQGWPASCSREAAILRIDIELSANRVKAACQAFDDLKLDPGDDLPGESDELRRLAARLLLAQGDARLALVRLQSLQQEEIQSSRQQSSVKTLVLLALAYQALDEEQACLDAIAQALFLAAPQGWLRPFLQHGQAMTRLLYQAATQDIQPDFISLLLDRLSQR